MYVNKDQIQRGVNRYIDAELGAKAVGYNKFLIYFAEPFINKKVNEYLTTFSKNELTKEMFDENGNIDLDSVYNLSKTAIRKSGQFSAYGIIFCESDFDKLYNYIRGEVI